MPKHRAFNVDRFLDKFKGNEELLQDYVAIWDAGLEVDPFGLDIEKFKDFLLEGGGSKKDDFLEDLYRANDMATESGHEHLVTACQFLERPPDPEGKLPVECLSLLVRTVSEEAFNRAYDRIAFAQAERFSVFRGTPGRIVVGLNEAVHMFRDELSRYFKGDKNSDRVLVRHYQEGSLVNVVVYHEKRTQAILVLRGSKVQPTVATTVLRPAQQDFISYDSETGRLELEARFEKEETALRRCFARCCLGDEQFFEGPESAASLSLKALADEHFQLEVDGEDSAALIELHFKLRQNPTPSFVVRSKNVLQTLRVNNMLGRLSIATIQKAVLKISFPDDKRGKRVELSGVNKLSFKRSTHAEDVLKYLVRWELLHVQRSIPVSAELVGQD